MLVPFTQICTKAMRQAKPLLSVQYAHPDVALAALASSETNNRPLLLTFDARNNHLQFPGAALGSVLEAARSTKNPVSVEVRVSENPEQIAYWLQAGALAISIDSDGESDYLATLNATHIEAVAYAVAVIACLNSDTDSLRERIGNTACSAVRFQMENTSSSLKLHHIKLPVIAETSDSLPQALRQYLKRGCIGVTIGRELDEAYTAGLRTALRNRSLFAPERAAAIGQKACMSVVDSYYNYLT